MLPNGSSVSVIFFFIDCLSLAPIASANDANRSASVRKPRPRLRLNRNMDVPAWKIDKAASDSQQCLFVV